MIRFITTTFFLIAYYASFACSCAETTIEKDFARCDIVFLGNVVHVQKLDSSNCHFVKVTFETSDVYKGKNNKNIEVVTSNQPSACGFDFNVCNEYLVFAYTSSREDVTKEKYYTSICNMTMHGIGSYEPIQIITKLRSSY